MKLISPQELEALIAAADVDVIDVREPGEWAGGHIPAARHVPLARLTANLKTFAPRDGVVFVCAKGGRSAIAAQAAIDAGFKDVSSLDGGTLAWAKANLPLTIPVRAKADLNAQPTLTDDDDAVDTELHLDAILSANLRAERTRAGVSLDDLASRAGVSRTLLGQIELGRTVPSIGVTWRIAQALGIAFSALLATSESGTLKVLHRAGARVLQSADGRFSSRALFPFGEPHRAEFYELTLAPHSREDADAHKRGTTENLFVASGRLELHVGARKVVMETGDAVLFTADTAHSYVNLGAEPCVMYLVMTYDSAP